VRDTDEPALRAASHLKGSKRSCIRKLELHSSYLRRKRAINNGVGRSIQLHSAL
jgi:hypothetical protein